MPSKPAKPTTVDAYIAQYPENVQHVLLQLRALIKKAAPGAEEKISYTIAGYFLRGKGLLWLSANKRYIGLYPMRADVAEFDGALLPYRGTKSALHFPLNQPIPYPLIKKIVKYRVAENLKTSQAAQKSAAKTAKVAKVSKTSKA